MKIGLIDVDSHNFPNLPLMKLSAWHKSIGDRTEWYSPWEGLTQPYDKVYMSKVFSFTPDYQAPIYANEVSWGGTGYAISTDNGRETYHKERDINLPDKIEHIYPDYSLYPEYTKDCAYGFLTRGCPRGCDFCHVASKEGRCSYKVADLDEFWKGQKKIVLNDPNILGCAEHKDLLQQLADSRAQVDFNQGIDIRLVTDKNIDLIRQIKLKAIHFADDRYEDKDIVEPKLKMFMQETGYDHHKIMCYILVNFNTTLEQDIHRIQYCRSVDIAPYPMIYDKEHCDPIYKKLQRWCNNFIFWKTPTFEEYRG